MAGLQVLHLVLSMAPDLTLTPLIRQQVVPLTVHLEVLERGSHFPQPMGFLAPLAKHLPPMRQVLETEVQSAVFLVGSQVLQLPEGCMAPLL